jgi:pre-mRNA-processing factor 40
VSSTLFSIVIFLHRQIDSHWAFPFSLSYRFPPPAKASLPPIPTAAALPSSGSAASPSSHYNPASLPPVPNLPSRPSADQYVIPEGGWASVAEAEEAFTYLLKKSNIDVDSTWDQVMRAIITDPLYKSLNSLAAKKAVFTKVRSVFQLKGR